jgi:hypothetical protein
LYEKGLDTICLRLIRKGYALARQNDLFHPHIEFIRWEMRLLKKAGANQDFQRLHELAKEDQAMAEIILLDAQLRALHDQLLEARTRPGISPPSPEPVLAKTTTLQQDLPFTLQNIVYYIRIHHAHLQGTLHLLKPYFQAMIHHWQQHPHQTKNHQDLYLTAWIGYLESFQYSEEPSAFRELLPYIRQHSWRKTQSYALVFYFTYYLELLHFLNHGQPMAEAQVDEQIKEGLVKYDAHLSTHNKMILMANLTTYYFVLGDLRRATEWNQRFLRSFSANLRKDLFEMAVLTEIMLLVEKGDLELLEFKWEAARKRFPAKQYPFAAHLHRFMSQLLKNQPDNEPLEELEKALDQPETAHLALMGHWAHSRRHGITLREAAFGTGS